MPLKFHKTSELDRQLIADWIKADPDHAGKSDVDFWLPPAEKTKRIDYFAVEDEEGTVMFIRAENCLRLHMQASPDRSRNAKAISEFTEYIANAAKKNYCQLIFESVFRPLIAFLKLRGFRASLYEYIRDLPE